MCTRDLLRAGCPFLDVGGPQCGFALVSVKPVRAAACFMSPGSSKEPKDICRVWPRAHFLGVGAAQGRIPHPRHCSVAAMVPYPQDPPYDSDGDYNHRSSTVEMYSDRLDRIEALVREEGVSTRSKIEQVVNTLALVSKSVDELKRAYRPGSSAGSVSGKTASSAFEERHPLLTQTIDSTFPVDLLSACVSASMQATWKRICFGDEMSVPSTAETNGCSEENCDEDIIDPVQDQKSKAVRYVKALLFGFQAKYTLKAYAEQDGADHTRFRSRLIKALLSNAAQREERRVAPPGANRTGMRPASPFWLKKHGIGSRRIDDFYERRLHLGKVGSGSERLSARGVKRLREGEEVSEDEEIALAVLKRLDGKVSTFLTKSREQVKAQLMDSFWFFLLQETANPRVSLSVNSDDKVKLYADIEETEHGQNLRTEDNSTNKARFAALLDSEELRFEVKYEVQVSGVPTFALRAPCFIRDQSGNVVMGSDGLPLADIQRNSNTLNIAALLCLAFTQSVDLDTFLSRTPNALRSLYAVAIFFRDIVKKHVGHVLNRDAISTSRATLGFLIAGESVLSRAVKSEGTISWQTLRERCEHLDLDGRDAGFGTSDLPDDESRDGSEDDYLVT